MRRTKNCTVCIDGLGFYARPCPGKGCGQQKPLDARMSAAYQWPVDSMLTPAMMKDSLRLRYPDRVV